MFSIPNLLTGLNLISGVASIILAFSGRLELAVVAIFIGAVFDFFDGFAARLLKKQGELGKQLDSLADMVTFGVAPGVLVFIFMILSGSWSLVQEAGGTIDDFLFKGTMGYSVQYWINFYLDNLVGNSSAQPLYILSIWYKIIPFGAFFIPFMSLFRLAKFNLDKRQSENFIGLPTPANTIFFASFGLLFWDAFGDQGDNFEVVMNLLNYQTLLPLVLVFSFLLVAEMPLFSLKFKSFGWKANQIRYLFLLFTVVLFLVLMVWSIPIIVLLYLVMSFVMKTSLNK